MTLEVDGAPARDPKAPEDKLPAAEREWRRVSRSRNNAAGRYHGAVHSVMRLATMSGGDSLHAGERGGKAAARQLLREALTAAPHLRARVAGDPRLSPLLD